MRVLRAVRFLRNRVGRRVGNSCAGQERDGRSSLPAGIVCRVSLYVHGLFMGARFLMHTREKGEGWRRAACFVSRCFGTCLCLNTSSASVKVLPCRLSWERGRCPRGETVGHPPPLREPWHWWRGTRCGTRVSVGSGYSSKPGRGWRSPQRPAASRTSRTARGPG